MCATQLKELVENEEKEALRQLVKVEKRKLIIRMRFDQLKREAEVLKKLPAMYDESMRKLDRYDAPPLQTRF